jgi:hypothetical protein
MIRTLLGVVMAFGVTGAASAQVRFRDIQARYGVNGPKRTSLELYPGDEIVFRYIVDGLKANADGKIDCTCVLKVLNESGKVIADKPTPLNSLLEFGGTTTPGYVAVTLGIKTPPGKYKIIYSVTDNLRNQSDTFERSVTCLDLGFAIVKPRFWHDQKEEISNSLNVFVGDRVYYSFLAVGFDRSQKKIDLEMKLQFLDEKGTELMPNPIVMTFSSVDPAQVEKAEAVTFRNSFNCNRAGTFKLRITLRDNTTKKTATFEAPVKVAE